MTRRIIPIRRMSDDTLPSAAPRLSGPPQQLQRVMMALELAVAQRLGSVMPTQVWLRELRLEPDEAHVSIAAGLGHDGLESAAAAFDTLRRLLPDTDIYVGAEPA